MWKFLLPSPEIGLVCALYAGNVKFSAICKRGQVRRIPVCNTKALGSTPHSVPTFYLLFPDQAKNISHIHTKHTVLSEFDVLV